MGGVLLVFQAFSIFRNLIDDAQDEPVELFLQQSFDHLFEQRVAHIQNKAIRITIIKDKGTSQAAVKGIHATAPDEAKRIKIMVLVLTGQNYVIRSVDLEPESGIERRSNKICNHFRGRNFFARFATHKCPPVCALRILFQRRIIPHWKLLHAQKDAGVNVADFLD